MRSYKKFCVECYMRLSDTDGKIVFNEAFPPHTLQGNLEVSSETVNTATSYPRDGLILLQLQVEDFNRAIQQGHEPAASGKDGLKAVQFIEATIKSTETGASVKLEPPGF